jgi:hypothetical protein
MNEEKICVMCRNFMPANTRRGPLCGRRTGKVSLVWGAKWKLSSPFLQRLGIGFDACGRKGKHFEPKANGEQG